MSGVTSWMPTPSQPRSTDPFVMICWTMFCASFEGIEKPIPTLPPVGEKIAELTPMTRPVASKSGPPELPWLMGASTWM